MNYDVAVVGAGVIGSLIARELSRYNIKIALVEKCNDTEPQIKVPILKKFRDKRKAKKELLAK